MSLGDLLDDAALLERVETFLSKAKFAPSRMGREVNGDPCLIFDMRQGRRLYPRLQRLVLDAVNALTWYA